MYALSESILQPMGECRVEMYLLNLNDFDEEVHVELRIFGEGEHESYSGEYIVMGDGEEISGSCHNCGTKEKTLLTVEDMVITALIKKHRKYGKGLS